MLKTPLAASLLVIALAAACGAVAYVHPANAGLSERDCFDSSNRTCITRGLNGPPLSSGSDGPEGVRWGCGPCSNVSRWYDELDASFKAGCAGGLMSDIVGKSLCLETRSNGMWDVVFGYFQSGGGGGFNYTRASFTGPSGTVAGEEQDPPEAQGSLQEAQDSPSGAQDYTVFYIIAALAVIAALIFLLKPRLLKKI